MHELDNQLIIPLCPWLFYLSRHNFHVPIGSIISMYHQPDIQRSDWLNKELDLGVKVLFDLWVFVWEQWSDSLTRKTKSRGVQEKEFRSRTKNLWSHRELYGCFPLILLFLILFIISPPAFPLPLPPLLQMLLLPFLQLRRLLFLYCSCCLLWTRCSFLF